MQWTWLVVGASAAIAMAACGLTDTDQSVDTDLAELSGTSWTLTFGAGPEGDIDQVNGFPITLNFDGDTIGGTAACNGYGATYRIDGNQFIINGLGWNEMGCATDVQAAEQAYFAALTDVASIDLAPGPQLALSGGSRELIFESNAPVPTDELVGGLWLLDTLIDGETASSVAGEAATLQLHGDGTSSGSTGCRTLTGRYVTAGNEIQFTDLAADGDCPNALADQDSYVISVIEGGFELSVQGDRLTLTSQGGVGLSYQAVTESEVEAAAPTPVPSDAELLSGSQWLFAGGNTPDGPLPDAGSIRPGEAISLRFSDGQISGAAFCNRYGAKATVGNGTIEIDEVASEEEGAANNSTRSPLPTTTPSHK